MSSQLESAPAEHVDAFLRFLDEAHESENTQESLNFVHAAFLLQRNTATYCKKVDVLHQDCFNALDMFSCVGTKGVKRRNTRKKQGTEVFFLSDDILLDISHKIAPGKDINITEASNLVHQSAPAHLPLALAPREESERKTNSMLALATPHPSGFYLLDAFDATLFSRTLLDLTLSDCGRGTSRTGNNQIPQSAVRTSFEKHSERAIFEGEGEEGGDYPFTPARSNRQSMYGGFTNPPSTKTIDGGDAPPPSTSKKGPPSAMRTPQTANQKKTRFAEEDVEIPESRNTIPNDPWAEMDPHSVVEGSSNKPARIGADKKGVYNMWGETPEVFTNTIDKLDFNSLRCLDHHWLEVATMGINKIGMGFQRELVLKKSIVVESTQKKKITVAQTLKDWTSAILNPALSGTCGRVKRNLMRCEREGDLGIAWSDFEYAERRYRNLQEEIEFARKEKLRMKMLARREQVLMAKKAADAIQQQSSAQNSDDVRPSTIDIRRASPTTDIDGTSTLMNQPEFELNNDLGVFYGEGEDGGEFGYNGVGEGELLDIQDELTRILAAADAAIHEKTSREHIALQRRSSNLDSFGMNPSNSLLEFGASGDDLVENAVMALNSQRNMMDEIAAMHSRVRSWTELIEPVLLKDLNRTEFDEKKGKELILSNAKSAIQQASKTESQNPCTTANFSHVVAGQPRWEVCRSFLLTLMLANEGKIEICPVEKDFEDVSGSHGDDDSSSDEDEESINSKLNIQNPANLIGSSKNSWLSEKDPRKAQVLGEFAVKPVLVGK